MEFVAVRSVAGSTHQASNRHSAATSRRKLCTMVSYFAILYAAVFDILHWSKQSVDFVLDHGDTIYRSVSHTLRNTLTTLNCYVHHAFHLMMSGCYVCLAVTCQALCILLLITTIHSLLLMVFLQTVTRLLAVWWLSAIHVWQLYNTIALDSHSHNSLSMPDDNGSAVLLEFSSQDNLHSHMRRLYAIPATKDVCLSPWHQRQHCFCLLLENVLWSFLMMTFAKKTRLYYVMSRNSCWTLGSSCIT